MDATRGDAAVRALELFQGGLSCAPAVLAACGARLGLDEAVAARLASAFGGGLAGSGGICGAVTGAMMVVGLARGPGLSPDPEAKAAAYADARELWRRFTERHGSVICRELLGVDIGAPGGRERAAEAGLFRDRCPALVETAAAIATALAPLDGDPAAGRR